MTGADRAPAVLGRTLAAFLAAEGHLPGGRVLTHAVVVFRTLETDGEGRLITRRGRCYPLGQMDPALERGMLGDAVFDARRERG